MLAEAHLSPSVPPPFPLHTPTMPNPRPNVCHFGTVQHIQGTREQLELTGFQGRRFRLTFRRGRACVSGLVCV